MGLNIPSSGGSSNGWKKTDWVSVADITATGTTVAESSPLALVFGGLEDFAEAVIEVRYMQAANTGGVSRAWVVLGGQPHSFVPNDTVANDIFTAYNMANDTARERRHLIRLDLFQSSLSYSSDRVAAKVRTKGTSDTAVSTVTNIRARLIYQKV